MLLTPSSCHKQRVHTQSFWWQPRRMFVGGRLRGRDKYSAKREVRHECCMDYGLQALRRCSLIHGLPSPEGTRAPPLWRQPLGTRSNPSQIPGVQLAQLVAAWSPSLYWPFPEQCPSIEPSTNPVTATAISQFWVKVLEAEEAAIRHYSHSGPGALLHISPRPRTRDMRFHTGLPQCEGDPSLRL